MPNPTASDLHVDVGLTGISQKYTNKLLIAEQIVPQVVVKKDSDLIFRYGKQSLRIDSSVRAPGTRAKQVDFTIDTTSAYKLVPHAYEGQIIHEVRDNADDPIKFEADVTEFVTEKLNIDLEKNILTEVQTAGNYGSTSSPTNKWNDYTNSDPIDDIDDAKNIIKTASLQIPNTMVMSWETAQVLRRHTKLLEFYKYTKGGKLSLDQLRELFEIEKLLISEAGYLSSKEGQTDALSAIMSDNVALMYVAPTPGLKQLSWGYLFRKQGYRMVERWYEAPVKSDFIRVEDKYDFQVIATNAGYLYTNVLA